MSIKIIAVGNRLMGDDGVAIQIIDKLSRELKDKGIEVIVGETDFQYCLSKVKEDDYLIILDATWFGIEPGTITTNILKDVHRLNANQGLFSQHGYSFIRALESFYEALDGIIIGIEGINFDYSLSLSSVLEENFQFICDKVYEIIWDRINKLPIKHKLI